MADEAPLIFEGTALGLLRPVNRPAVEAAKAMIGQKVVVKVTKMTRNQRRRGFYWTMLDVVAEVLADKTGTPWDADTLHDDLRETLGLGVPLKSTSGRKVWKRRSTSDKSMTEIDRAAWTNRVANYLSRMTGIEMSQLIDEVRNRGGGEAPDPIDEKDIRNVA